MQRPFGSRFPILVSFIVWSILVMESARATDHEDHTLWTARWNHDGTLFAIGGAHTLLVFDSHTLKNKSLLPNAPVLTSDEANSLYMAVTRVAWHPRSDLLAVSSQGKNLSGIYDFESGERTALTAQRVHFGRGVSWSPDGVLLAFTNDDRLQITKADGTVMQDIPRYRDAKGLSGVAWSPTGSQIVTIGSRITLHTEQGEPIKQLIHRPEVHERDQLLLSVAWHPSGDFFAVGDYGTEVDDPVLQFWSSAGELLKSILLEGDTQIRDLSWNKDGSRLASASSRLKIWTKDGKLLHETESPDHLWGVDWCPDSENILTSSVEGRVTLWNSAAEVVKEIIVPPGSQAPAANGNKSLN